MKNDLILSVETSKIPEAIYLGDFVVPVAGLEPARYRYRWILSPLRLPIPSHRHIGALAIIQHKINKIKYKFYKI